jgi:cupin 2 domain-containing protein
LLLTDAARLQLEGDGPLELLPGSFVNIPAHKRHRVEWTDPAQTTIWLAIHYSRS